MWLVSFQTGVSGKPGAILATYAAGVAPGLHTLSASVEFLTGRIRGELGELVRDAWSEITATGIAMPTGEHLAWQIQQMLNASG